MKIFARLLKSAAAPTKRTAIWLLKWMLPITLGVSVLDHYGVIAAISGFLSPVFGYFGLSGEASIVFITSIFSNIYAAIGVMAGLTLDIRQVTILATMCLISHNLIIETKVQQKAGAKVWFIVPLRIGMSVIVAFALDRLLPAHMDGRLVLEHVENGASGLADVLLQWVVTTLPLIVKVVVIIYALNLLQAVLREFDLNRKLEKPIAPLMKFMGMSPSVSLLWLIANTLGLAYGGLAINDELSRGYIAKKESSLLNTSIAITHSLLEDTFLFVVIGVPLLWAVLPRFVLSVVAVWGQRLYYSLVDKRSVRPVMEKL